MAVIKTSSSDVDILARLMRAEAEGEGELGMLNAGNVMVNRVRAACLDFVDIIMDLKWPFNLQVDLKPFKKAIFINAPATATDG